MYSGERLKEYFKNGNEAKNCPEILTLYQAVKVCDNFDEHLTHISARGLEI